MAFQDALRCRHDGSTQPRRALRIARVRARGAGCRRAGRVALAPIRDSALPGGGPLAVRPACRADRGSAVAQPREARGERCRRWLAFALRWRASLGFT